MGILEGQLATITKNTMKKVIEDKGYAFFENGDLVIVPVKAKGGTGPSGYPCRVADDFGGKSVRSPILNGGGVFLFPKR